MPGVTKEHIPPRAFFPEGKREQLLTVPSCETHNNAKSGDDLYVLAHICMNASPANDSREVFMKTVAPQLGYNEDKLRRLLARGATHQPDGAVAYQVDTTRFDRFFSALACGIVYKSAKRSLPLRYTVRHVYHNLAADEVTPEELTFRESLADFYSDDNEGALEILNFGDIKTLNATVYTASLFGLPDFASSITIVHKFFGDFRVTSMLSNHIDMPGETSVGES